MPYRKEQFINDGIYHIILRAIDNNVIFKNINDYYRGIFSIYEFNNAKAVSIKNRRKIISRLKKVARDLVSGGDLLLMIDKRERLVDILSFCFMPNHIHLLLKQIKNNGIAKFMHKFGAGYGGYSNRKYKRKGHVFQDRFKSVYIKNDDQLKTVFVYIHTNPISLIESKWKEIGIKNLKEVIRFLENYKWSSYLDYISKKNFPSVTEREFLLETIGGIEGCKDFIDNWIKHKGKIKEFDDLLLE